MTDDQMLLTYRHDAHKMRGGSHSAGSGEIAGVKVNEDVPYGADKDASDMSRPPGSPQQVMDDHDTHYRISLITGDTAYDARGFSLKQVESDLKDLLTTEDAKEMHKRWLNEEVVSAFNESTYYPYTSLKYHTLLVAALVANYRDGYEYDDLYLCVTDEVVTHKTVYSGKFSLSILPRKQGEGHAKLSDNPWRNWNSVWSRLTYIPIDNEENRFGMTLDAQLRRIKAWSTALQYIEDYQTWWDKYA